MDKNDITLLISEWIMINSKLQVKEKLKLLRAGGD